LVPNYLDRISRWEPLYLGLIPGTLAGSLLTGLLLFLNPRLQFGVSALIRGTLFYGSALGLISAVVMLVLCWRDRPKVRRLLPWSITLVLGIAAVGCWYHASHFSYFLPPGINVRLIKAALLLTLAALIFFYTALVHSARRRPYGIRSRVGLTILAAVSIYVVAERREAFKPRIEPTPLPSSIEKGTHPRLLVVGIEGGSLDAILPLARQGHLPFFAKLIAAGAYGRLASIQPVESSALWTSLATGKHPHKHGILGERVFSGSRIQLDAKLRIIPQGIGFPIWGTGRSGGEQIDMRFRESLTLWEILRALGVRSGVLGWPVTYPVTEALGFSISDRFFEEESLLKSAHPPELGERAALFRVQPEEISPEIAGTFGPSVPFEVLESLASDLWRESLASFVLDHDADLGAAFLMLPGLSEVSQGYFGGYHAAQFRGAQKQPQQQASQLITAYYRHLGLFVEQIWERVEAPKILAVVSVHGYESAEGLRKMWWTLSGRNLQGSLRGGPDGVLILSGEGVKTNGFLDAADLEDVMPTLLYALGFPIARDLDGQVLTSAFSTNYLARHPLTFVPSYETLATQEPFEELGARATASPELPPGPQVQDGR
jgi:hypothetical protein